MVGSDGLAVLDGRAIARRKKRCTCRQELEQQGYRCNCLQLVCIGGRCRSDVSSVN